MNIEFLDEQKSPARIRVVGVGGCGGNIIRCLQNRPVAGIECAAVNTDAQALSQINGAECVQIGENVTRGLGAGANYKIAAEAAEQDSRRLQELVRGYDMVFIAAGIGKGTGTGVSPVIARLAREENTLTVAVVALSFRYEKREHIVREGLQALSTNVDSLLVVPNDNLGRVLGDVPYRQALLAANDVLYNAVCGISEIITKPGEMNLDFNDVRAVMSANGKAVMGSACASGPDRAVQATQEALCCPLMEDSDLSTASHFLVNITGHPEQIKMSETEAVQDAISEKAPNCNSERFLGLVYDESMGEDMRVTVIATGIGGDEAKNNQEGGKPNLEVIKANAVDNCFTSGRQRQRQKAIVDGAGGDARKVPTIMRRQCN